MAMAVSLRTIARVDSDGERGEQVMVLRTTAAARRVMSLILTYAKACGNTVTIGRPSIGDGALALTHSYQREGDGVPVVEDAVAVGLEAGVGLGVGEGVAAGGPPTPRPGDRA